MPSPDIGPFKKKSLCQLKNADWVQRIVQQCVPWRSLNHFMNTVHIHDTPTWSDPRLPRTSNGRPVTSFHPNFRHFLEIHSNHCLSICTMTCFVCRNHRVNNLRKMMTSWDIFIIIKTYLTVLINNHMDNHGDNILGNNMSSFILFVLITTPMIIPYEWTFYVSSTLHWRSVFTG